MAGFGKLDQCSGVDGLIYVDVDNLLSVGSDSNSYAKYRRIENSLLTCGKNFLFSIKLCGRFLFYNRNGNGRSLPSINNYSIWLCEERISWPCIP